MRTYIFTKREVELLKAFLNGEATRVEIRDLKHRMKLHGEQIKEQVNLMERAMKKLEK